MSFLKAVWRSWKKLGFFIGEVVSGIILTVFYFVIFPFFAVPFIFFGKNNFKTQSAASNWIIKKKTPSALSDFETEF